MDETGKMTVIKDQKQMDDAEKEYVDMFGNLSDGRCSVYVW